MALSFFKNSIFLLCISFSLPAQEKKEAQNQRDVNVPGQEKKTETPLPKIELPEFVITRQETISLPENSKSEIEEDHSYEPAKSTLGSRHVTLGGEFSPKQTKNVIQQPQPLNGKIYTGIGFFTTPMLDGWFGQRSGENSFVVNSYYHLSNGHVNFSDWWKGGIAVKGKYVLPESSAFMPYSQVRLGAQYDRDSYKAFASRSPSRVRDLSFFDLSVGFGSRYALPYRSLSGFDYSGTIGMNIFSANDSRQSFERDVYISGNASTQFEDLFLRGQLDYRNTSFDIPVSVQNGQWFVLRFDGRKPLSQSLQLGFALQQFIYRGNVGAANGRLYPQAELRYFMTEEATLFLAFNPTVERNTLSNITRRNKYINFDGILQPTDVPVGLQMGTDVRISEQMTTSAKINYRHINNYLTFLDSTDAKVWEVLYLSGVQSTKFDVRLSYTPEAKTIATGYFSTTREIMEDSKTFLPYVPSFNVGAIYYHTFNSGVNVEATMEFVSSRKTNFTDDNRNASYVYSGLKADILLVQHFRTYAELGNALNQEYYIWKGYRERTFFILLGISYSW